MLFAQNAAAGSPSNRPAFILISSDDGPTPPWMPFLDCPENDHLCIELRSRNAGRQNRWAARLDQTVRSATGPVILVASGASCLAVAWWARLSPSIYVSPVAGAIFLAPADPYGADSQGGVSPFAGPPTLLPFPSVMVAGEDDGTAASLARAWGSQLADGERPVATYSGTGLWRERERLLAGALGAILERRGAGNARRLAVVPAESATP